jgi:hypothetical protein
MDMIVATGHTGSKSKNKIPSTLATIYALGGARDRYLCSLNLGPLLIYVLPGKNINLV